MRFKIKGKKEFRVLAKHINDGTSYNVNIAEVSLMSGGFTDEQRLELAKIVAETIAITVPPLIEKALTEALAPIYERLDKIEANIKLIMSLPTIKKELLGIKQH